MAEAVPAPGPIPRRAIAALALAVVAFGLSLYGSLLSEGHLPGSPLNAARGGIGVAESENARIAVVVVGYALPFVLGVAAAVIGGRVLQSLDHQPGHRLGHFAAVFAVMVGGLAAVVSACMVVGVYGWPYVPHYYDA